jgi:Na+/melibiose symporter-like transporter
MQRKNIDTKHILFKISSSLLMLIGFVGGVILAMFLMLPMLKMLGPDPNRFIVIFVVLPVVVIIAAIVGYLGIFMAMLLWKPLLSSEEARKYVFEPRTPDDEIPRAINLIFVKPYYKIARLIYPDAENDTDSKQQRQS